ncbi:hypothetical protein NIES593_05960 [Hydrococcus rivularis NIES-593]|uniref:O-antigen polymerase n=1 Tax=Hydrococcus rivularis NIES-593 TaxID=1921803 RepID=A0A1U7HML9_9CYAN|nr:hypothetical protein [Hydrococcus rivularis]OKH24765.1 hypothetical protein NIES593_05960 [Hydrococcus rivularis NIES-593]
MNASKEILIIIVILSLAAFASALLITVDSPRTRILCTAAIVCMTLAYKHPRLGLWTFLIYLPFGGTVTYAVVDIYRAVHGRVTYSSDALLFHLVKDTVYFPALIALIVSSPSFQKFQRIAKPLILAIGSLLGACLLTLLFVNLSLQLANPQNNFLLVGAIGLKSLIGYVPLILCGYYLIRDQKDLFFLNRLLVALTLICCGLCFVQFFLLSQGICPGNSLLPEPASSKASLLARCFVGGSLLYNPAKGLIRLPGTFVAPWQWAWFLIANSFFVFGASLSDPSRCWRWLGWTSVGLLLATTIISGQRAALLCVPIILLVLFLLSESNRKQLALKLGIMVFLGFLIFNSIEKVQKEWLDLVGRWNYSPPPLFVLNQFRNVLENYSAWLGQGLGLATNAARRLGNTVLIETFYAKLLYEIGWIGLLSFLLVVSMLALLTFRAYRSLEKPSLRRLAFCWWTFILFIGYNTYYYPLTVDPVAVYFWFIGGVMLKLPELERQKSFDPI